jgi:chromosome partitioning protein
MAYPPKVKALSQRKGGVAKTTSAVNLSAMLAKYHGRRVLLWDCDSQGHASKYLGMQQLTKGSPSYGVLAEGRAIIDCAQPTGFGFDLLAGGQDLSTAEALMGSNTSGNGRMVIREALEELPAGRWDVVLLDCPPSLKDMTQAALIACNGVLVPLPMEPLPYDGFEMLMTTIEGVRRYSNQSLAVQAIFEATTDPRTLLAATIRDRLDKFIEQHALLTPELLLSQRVRRNIRLAEACDAAKPITHFDETCHGAADYRALADELVARGIL